MKRFAVTLAFRICTFLACLHLLSSATASQTESQPTPTFRASSHLVLLDVVITDKNENPVPGLRLEDFVVKEDGKPQKAAFLTPPEEKPSQSPAALPPGVYSNEPAYRLSGAVPTVIVLDAVNTAYKDQIYARGQMLKYLREQYKPGQRIAVFGLTDRLTLLQDFTDDPEVLQACLKRFDSSATVFPTVASSADPSIRALAPTSASAYMSLSAALSAFQRGPEVFVTDRRAEVTLDALSRITRILGGLRGRKAVIWLTGGFPFALIPEMNDSASEMADLSQRSMGGGLVPITGMTSSFPTAKYTEQIREIAARMATSQVAIYPVDARGLLASRALDVGQSQEALREIARETGGRAFVNRNDIVNGVALTLRDHEATYTLGYYPTNKKWDRKYRTIDVKVNRSGLETTYRRGYFAFDFAQAGARSSDVSEALADQAPNTMVTFQAKVTSGEGGKTRVEFLVDPASLSVADQAGQKSFNVSFYVAALSPEGKVLSAQGTKLDRAFPADSYQKILQQGMRLHLDIDPPTTSKELRLAVRDNRTGYVGTLTAPVPTKQ